MLTENIMTSIWYGCMIILRKSKVAVQQKTEEESIGNIIWPKNSSLIYNNLNNVGIAMFFITFPFSVNSLNPFLCREAVSFLKKMQKLAMYLLKRYCHKAYRRTGICAYTMPEISIFVNPPRNSLTESYFGTFKAPFAFHTPRNSPQIVKHSFSFIFNDRCVSNVPHVHFDVFIFVSFEN